MSKSIKPVLPKHELRVSKNAQGLEIRTDAQGKRTISGYFAKFNVTSNDLGGFVERIKPGAFSNLKDNPDIVADYNHNADQILARVSNGSLTVSQDSIGFKFRMSLATGVSYISDLVSLMEQNLISDCSFAFTVNDGGDSWAMEGDQLVRTLTSITVYSGSIVGQPAYPQTVADLRSCPVSLRGKLKRSDDDMDDDNPCNPNGSAFDPSACPDLDDSDTGDDDSDDEWSNRSEKFKHDYTCPSCRAIHQNIQEDDPTARSKRQTKDVLQKRCEHRSGHAYTWQSFAAGQDDDGSRAANKHLLSLRSR
jgi:HK97 family phage prohead protease